MYSTVREIHLTKHSLLLDASSFLWSYIISLWMGSGKNPNSIKWHQFVVRIYMYLPALHPQYLTHSLRLNSSLPQKLSRSIVFTVLFNWGKTEEHCIVSVGIWGLLVYPDIKGFVHSWCHNSIAGFRAVWGILLLWNAITITEFFNIL